MYIVIEPKLNYKKMTTEQEVNEGIAEAISNLTYIYTAMNNKVIISVDGTEYLLSEVSNLGDEIILHAEIDRD